jgi:hypothetical protein
MNHSKPYTAIDCGLDGGIATLHNGDLYTAIMPTIKLGKGRAINVYALNALFKHWSLDPQPTLIIEDPGPHAQSASGLRSMTRSFAIVETLAIVYELRYETVISRKWQSEFWSRPKMPKGQKFDTKAAALVAANRIWPRHDWRVASEKTGKLLKNPHTGVIDAALLAEWGRRKLG